ncbi:MAG: hypothetical protein AB7F32_11630 [Victivallaceae bacterium]
MSDIVKVEAGAVRPLTAAEMTEQVSTIQRVMQAVMIRGTHYDRLPGCGDKPVLLKPGAEKILATFRLGVETVAEELGDGFDIRYRVICRGFYIPTGNTVGYGIGEASTGEKKYKWREAVCDEEYNDTPETRRNILYRKDRNGAVTKVFQVRQNPSDIANTVLKMAKKRAMVDLCLTATACSDIFEQDIDDPDTAEATGAAPRYQQPAQRQPEAPPPAGDVISEKQNGRLWAIARGKQLADDETGFIIFNVGAVNSSKDIPRDKYEAVIAAIEAATPGKVINA